MILRKNVMASNFPWFKNISSSKKKLIAINFAI